MVGITPLPTPPSTSDPTNFNTRADALMGALPAFVTEANAYAAYLAAAAQPAAAYIALVWVSGTSGDPGNGGVGGNNATQNASTSLRIDNLDALGNTVSAITDTFSASTSLYKGFLRVQKVGDPNKWLLFRVNGAVVNSTGYRTVPAEILAGTSSSPFTSADAVVITFSPTGDKGDPGSAVWGSAGSTTTITGTPTTVSIALATTYGDIALKCTFNMFSGNDIRIDGSTDGTNFTNGPLITTTAASAYGGTVLLTDYRDTQVMAHSSLDTSRVANLSGPLVAVRFVANGGTFTGGSIRPRGH